MADVTISNLPIAPSLNSAGVFPYSNGTSTFRASLNQIIPTGVIVMWSGSIASIPSGWALCNGTNGTPDLRNKFIIGASVDVSGQSQTGVTGANTKTGGTKDAIVVSHTHPITDPGHIHSITAFGTGVSIGNPIQTGSVARDNLQYNFSPTNSSTTGITINSQGSSGTNQNLPPYYALAYIMKL